MKFKSKIMPYAAGLALCLGAAASAVAADYCQSGNLTRTSGGRCLNSFSLTDGVSSVAVQVGQGSSYGSASYFDKTTSKLSVQPGATISFDKLSWTGEWMHGFVYIDYNNDGTFNTTLNADGQGTGELVAYSFYSAAGASTSTNSRGATVINSSGVNVNSMPSFTIPSNLVAGEYRLRFKVDWNDLNPCGGTIQKDGGSITDITLVIESAEVRTVTVKSADTSKGTVSIIGSDNLSVTRAGGVEINATPKDGYAFLRWVNDANSQQYSDKSTVTVYGNDNISLTAEFGDEEEDPSVVSLPKVGADGAEIIALSSLDISKMVNGWGTQQANKSIDGNPLKLKGITYKSGIGAHASARVNVKLNGAVAKFHCMLGIDDEVAASCRYNSTYGVANYTVKLIRQDGAESEVATGVIRADATPAVIDVDNLQTYKYLVIDIPEGTGGDSYDHVDIANAYFEYKEQNSTRPIIVADADMSGSLDCATILFSQPGVKFMHKLRCNNQDAEISVSGLPAGLEWNERRSLVEGVIDTEGEYSYMAHVTVEGETSDVPISLTVSSKLQQPVPFMGWLSWNVVQSDISESVIRTVADAMVSQGLADAGYNYLVIDDLWHSSYRQSGTNKPQPSPTKFPNGMKVCADYVHEKGLKFGIYSDAAEKTCANAYGSYGYETIDANQYAEWGVDLLKYDYCGAPSDAATAKTRYKTMGDALKASGRDILFYMCEWGVREPWKWATETGATCWRATYDTRDGWNGKDGGIGIVESVAGMKDLWPYHGVNRFNDADMMCVGIHGTGKSSNDLVVKPGMTMTEYGTQFAMWCMWGSPLTLSFDLRKSISAEDLALMTNPELIAINQDRMGQAAEFVYEDGNQVQLYFKDLENGDVAVAVLNMGSATRSFKIDFADISALDAVTTYEVRDLVNRESLDKATGSMTVSVNSHETRVFRLSKDTMGAISAPGVDGEADMAVSDLGSKLRVSLSGSEGATKRVLVSDIEGRVLVSATGTGEVVELDRPAGPQTVVVNLVCGAKAYTGKVLLR